MNQKTKDTVYFISAMLVLFAAVTYYFNPNIARYIMVPGVVGLGIVVFMSPYPGKSLRGKRLFNMQVFAVLLMAVSACLMFMMMNQWVVPLLIAGILILYSSVLLPKELEKENKEK